MAYTVTLFPIDLGGFIGTGPALNGTFLNVSPVLAVDTATATTAVPFTLAFTTATPPPPGVVTLHVANSGPTGDLFRSGFLTGLPPSPGTVTVLSIPNSLTRLSAAAITAMAARIGTILLTPPTWLAVLMGILSAGTYIPLTGAITGVVPTLNTPAGSVSFTVTGFFTFRTYYFWTDTITFTGTLVATPAPSGDATQPGRILSLSLSTALATTTTGPSPTLSLTGLFLSLVAPAVGAIFQSPIEALINSTIDSLVAPGLASMGFLRSPSSVVSARSVTITATGMVLSLVLADLFGGAISAIPGNLRAVVSPAPKAGTQQAYTVTVTDSATGTPVPSANVTLHNFTTTGAVQTLGPSQTPAPPQANTGQVTFNVALHPKITFRVIPGDHERVRVFAPPTLTVSKAGFNTISVRLLEDDAGP